MVIHFYHSLALTKFWDSHYFCVNPIKYYRFAGFQLEMTYSLIKLIGPVRNVDREHTQVRRNTAVCFHQEIACTV